MISNNNSPLNNIPFTNNIIRNQLNNTQISLRNSKSTILSSIIIKERISSVRSHINLINNSSISSINSSLDYQSSTSTICKVKTIPRTIISIESTSRNANKTNINQFLRNNILNSNIHSSVRTMISNNNSPLNIIPFMNYLF